MTQALAAAIVLCSWTKPGGVKCEEAATHSFRWEWGEEGTCCSACAPLVTQAATNLGRTVAIKPLDASAGVAPVTRHERTQLIAAKLAAEAELEEVQQRGAQLYQSNVDLTAQVQTHVMRARERESQIAEKDDQIERLSADLEKRERELAEATAELQRLRVLAQFAPSAESRVGAERGLLPPEG
jgi:DNA repair exonuclease SbcCD ATPase subunit